MNRHRAIYQRTSVARGDESKPFGGQFLRTDDACRVTGYARQTIYDFMADGLFPPPRHVIGNVKFFAREDIDFFMKTHRARPNQKKSVRLKRAREQRGRK